MIVDYMFKLHTIDMTKLFTGRQGVRRTNPGDLEWRMILSCFELAKFYHDGCETRWPGRWSHHN